MSCVACAPAQRNRCARFGRAITTQAAPGSLSAQAAPIHPGRPATGSTRMPKTGSNTITTRADAPDPGTVAWTMYMAAREPAYQQHDPPEAQVSCMAAELWQQLQARDAPRRRPSVAVESSPACVQGPPALEAHLRETEAARASKRQECLADAAHKAYLWLRVHRTQIRRELARRPQADARRKPPHSPTRARGRRRETRPGVRRQARAARSKVGGSPGPEPDPDPLGVGDFTDDEALRVATAVTELYPGALTPAQFDIATSPHLFGLNPEQTGNARLRVFLQLPDQLQQSFYSSLIRVSRATWAPAAAAVDRQAGHVEGGAS